jgi:hypothetical protein
VTSLSEPGQSSVSAESDVKLTLDSAAPNVGAATSEQCAKTDSSMESSNETQKEAGDSNPLCIPPCLSSIGKMLESIEAGTSKSSNNSPSSDSHKLTQSNEENSASPKGCAKTNGVCITTQKGCKLATKCEEGEVSDSVSQKLEMVRGGLVRKQAESIGVADLYLMMGGPDRVVLEYEWCDITPGDEVSHLNNQLTNMLRRLVHLATTEFTDFKTRQVSLL